MKAKRPLIVIEHLEDIVSKWLWAEYKHAANIAKDKLVLTNAHSGLCGLVIRELKIPCYSESIVKLQGVLYSTPEKVVILDPQAKDTLKPHEARRADIIVVGGILGDHPPRGRTRQLLSSRMPKSLKRNIGKWQFSIDGAVYIALEIVKGRSLEEIPVVKGYKLIVRWDYNLDIEVELPYAYPLVNGKPLLAPELPRLLATGLAYEEYKLNKQLLR